MDTLRIARWLVRVDVRRTAEAHAALSSGGATECRCDGCKNFEAVRPQLLRGPLGDVLRQLGVSPPFEVEAFEQGRAASGLHHYGGWFHFVGEIVSGRSVQEVGHELFLRLLQVASGEPTCSERLGVGDEEFVPWTVGPVM